MKLNKLKKIDLRKAWTNEAFDFTRWLAQEENMAILSEEIGIEMATIQTEANVGKFSVDILAEEESTGRKIVIENQLEMTNHDHLGKIVTYASGIDAQIVIWIVKEVRDEHKRAIDWLNEHTGEDINFFAIKMELWQIGDSDYAPKFQIISKPNEWAKVVKQSAAKGQLTETKTLQLEFWNSLKEFIENNKSFLKMRTPRPQHWYDVSIGSSGVHISLTFNSFEGIIACELYIPDDEGLYKRLFENRSRIEKELGEKLIWMDLPGRKASRIKSITRGKVELREQWNQYFSWFKNEAEKFHTVFGKYI